MISEYLKRGGLAALVFAAVALVAAAFWAGDSATARGLARNGETATARSRLVVGDTTLVFRSG